MKLYEIGEIYSPARERFNRECLLHIIYSGKGLPVCKSQCCDDCPFFKEIKGEGFKCIVALKLAIAEDLLEEIKKEKFVMCDGVMRELIEVEE